MIVSAIAFYVFAAMAVAAGFMVIAARNPVHSVLFLILTFFNAAALFVLMGAEFIALILVIVYVGAVAVLFLFVVMMLDIDFAQLRQGFLQYLPIGGLVGLILLIELLLVAGAWVITPEAMQVAASPAPALEQAANTRALGQILYTQYAYLFQAAGLILLVAMIGAIVLTLRHRVDIKRQVISRQVGRKRHEGVELKDVKPGQGI
ncbi:NADH-quinone oxidoreductase subunit J [Parvibaculum sedimenti]|uniref:NADH-quinone oxidoreductase subunit J n=1 Tax=Parvibaculum sedimenti TaxID=2608632 RepID=A0A6N6VF54_9HYPH|nr:NADH-quinone oxidoreductase subunit J [Parvibaculum sedimenti]KAB7739285.1 NADH-quinone oxidoreductase subunit J [Parvibaculum sedimenti]